jgi:hypothetical protein
MALGILRLELEIEPNHTASSRLRKLRSLAYTDETGKTANYRLAD